MPDLLFTLVLNADVHVDRVLIRQLCSVLHHFAIIVSRCDAVVGWKRHTYWGATRHIFESERGVPRSAFDLWALMHAGMLSGERQPMKPHGLKQVRGIFGTALETSASSSISSTRSALRSRLAQQLRSTVQLQHDRWYHAYLAATRELHLLLDRRVIPRMAPQPRSGTPSMLMHNVAVFFTVLDGSPQVDSARSALGSPVALAFEGGCNTARAAVQSLAAARKMAAGARRTVSRLAQRPHPCAHLRMARGAMQRLDAAQKGNSRSARDAVHVQ